MIFLNILNHNSRLDLLLSDYNMAERSTTPVNQMIKPATQCPGAPARKMISTPERLTIKIPPFNGDFTDPRDTVSSNDKPCPGAPMKTSCNPRTLEEYRKKLDFGESTDGSPFKKARMTDRPPFME